MSIRTNNNTEASHRSLNKRVGECHINIYKLVFFIRMQNAYGLLVLLLTYRKSIDNKRHNLNRTTIVLCLSLIGITMEILKTMVHLQITTK